MYIDIPIFSLFILHAYAHKMGIVNTLVYGRNVHLLSARHTDDTAPCCPGVPCVWGREELIVTKSKRISFSQKGNTVS